MAEKYAKCLTRDYLESIGITDVTTDGRVFRNGVELTPIKCGGNSRGDYYYIGFYYKGDIMIPLHRLMYAWYHRFIPSGMVVDHINENKLDNRLENLQLLTPGENLKKSKGIKEVYTPCKLYQDRQILVDKINQTEEEIKAAKLNKVPIKDQKYLYSRLSRIRNQLRFYDKYRQDYLDYVKYLEGIGAASSSVQMNKNFTQLIKSMEDSQNEER